MGDIKLKWVSKKGEAVETWRLLWPLEKEIKGSLSNEVHDLFDCQRGGPVKVYYVDEDGDWITLSKVEELTAALAMHSNRLSIFVFPTPECEDMSPSAVQGILKKATSDKIPHVCNSNAPSITWALEAMVL